MYLIYEAGIFRGVIAPHTTTLPESLAMPLRTAIRVNAASAIVAGVRYTLVRVAS